MITVSFFLGRAYTGTPAKPRGPLEDCGALLAYKVVWKKKPSKAQLGTVARITRSRPFSLPGKGVLVVAKRGMLSAWTAKATGILEKCGLPVAGIEQGVLHKEPGTAGHDPVLEDLLVDGQIKSWHGRGEGSADPQTAIHGRQPQTANLGLALHPAIADAISREIGKLGRGLTEAESTVLAQVNSDHCRHWTFRAPLSGIGVSTPMLESVKSTLSNAPAGTLVAFCDNAAVLEFGEAETFARKPGGHLWQTSGPKGEALHTVLKSETHNHPTAIAPFPGAATGVGGEIRDEVATGAGACSLAGIAGYIVSALGTGDLPPTRECGGEAGLQDPMRILVDAPLGAAAYSNEFGRPTIAGFCRSFEGRFGERLLGFRKPVMLAGGIGEVRASSLKKRPARLGDLIVQLGGPGMRIGIGGGLEASGHIDHGRDLSLSVQRDNAEMQRRVQQAVEACYRSPKNPLRKLHDVGAGGIANSAAELASSAGCMIDLDRVPVAQEGLGAGEILCNEAQERYLALVAANDLERLEQTCAAEDCPVSVIGTVSGDSIFQVRRNGKAIVDLPCSALFPEEGMKPLLARPWQEGPSQPVDPTGIDLARACHLVLAHPAVADKSFLVTIADRNVGGLVSRDQMAGPHQVAAADCGVVLAGHHTLRGRAVAAGERAPLAAHAPAAAARIAIAESLTNLAAAPVGSLDKVKLSLNWLADASTPEGVGELATAVRGACDGFMLDLKLAAPSGKDSVSMRAEIKGGNGDMQAVTAPATCVAIACGHVDDCTRVLVPQLSGDRDTVLMHLDACSARALGGSVLADVLSLAGNDVPDIAPGSFRGWWEAVSALHESGAMLAYHDISDGGMLAAACEMAFAARCGVTLVLDVACQADGIDTDGSETSLDAVAAGGIADVARELFCEGTGAIIEVARKDAGLVIDAARKAGMARLPQTIGWPTRDKTFKVLRNAQTLLAEPIDKLFMSWRSLATKVRTLRDGPVAVAQESEHALQSRGLYASPASNRARCRKGKGHVSAMVLRDSGTNGHVEMAAALDKAGFATSIVPINELLGKDLLSGCDLLVLPGGFSHGDVLGAGVGTACVTLENKRLRRQFASFFARPSLALGICNGCQVLGLISELYTPGTTMPFFTRNSSRRFAAHLAQVEILPNPSPFLARLAGMRLPVPVSCGEGRAVLPEGKKRFAFASVMRFVDENGLPASTYPQNPTGAQDGLCGFATHDGKVTMLMPHPERAVRTAQMSWHPPGWQGDTPWLDCFADAHEHLLGV